MNKLLSTILILVLISSCVVAQTRPDWLDIKNKPTYDVREYGAKGDGVTDDTAKIQAAIDAAHAAGGGEVWLHGNHAVSTIGLRSGVTLRGRSASLDKLTSSARNVVGRYIGTSIYTDATGRSYEPTPLATLTASATAGAVTIAVTSVAGLAVGDRIALDNGGNYRFHTQNVESDPQWQREIIRIKSIAGLNITLESPLTFAYNVSHLVDGRPSYIIDYEAVVLDNAGLKDLSIVSSGVSHSVYLVCASHFNMSGVVIKGRGATFDSWCQEVRVAENTFFSTAGTWAIGLVSGTTSSTVAKNRIVSSVPANGHDGNIILYLGTNNCAVVENAIEGIYKTDAEITSATSIGITIHTKSYNNVVSNNTVKNCDTGIQTLFGSWANTIDGNTITGARFAGIYSYSSRSNVIANNTIFGGADQNPSLSAGILSAESADTSISGNQVYGAQLKGIALTSDIRSISTGNVIRGATTGVSLFSTVNANVLSNMITDTDYGIKVVNTAQALRVFDNTLIGRSASPSVGIYITSAFESVCKDNDVSSFSIGIYSNNSQGSTIADNRIFNTYTGIFLFTYSKFLASLKNNLISSATIEILGQEPDLIALAAAPQYATDTALLQPTGFTVYAPVVGDARTILGWRRKDATTLASAGWRIINIDED